MRREVPEESGCDGGPSVAEVDLEVEERVFLLGSEGGSVDGLGEFVQVAACIHVYRPRHCF